MAMKQVLPLYPLDGFFGEKGFAKFSLHVVAVKAIMAKSQLATRQTLPCGTLGIPHEPGAITTAALAFGVTRETLRRAMAEAVLRGDVHESKDKKYRIREVHAVLAGDITALRKDKLRLTNKELAFDLAVKQRKSMETEECAKFILDNFNPIREAVVAMPGELAALVNPADPVHARSHLERFRDDFLKAAKARVPLAHETTT
jgi:hypothetical protein